MGLRDIEPMIRADNRKKVMHWTWGHLFPDKDETFIGAIRIAETAYGELIILEDSSNVPSSPWWHSSLIEFISDFLMKEGEPGFVYELKIKAVVERNEEDSSQTLKVENCGHQIVLNPTDTR